MHLSKDVVQILVGRNQFQFVRFDSLAHPIVVVRSANETQRL